MVHPEEHLLIAGLVIEGELCREGAARVCSPALTSAGQNFAQNIQTLASMLSLPWVLLMHAQLPVFELFATTLALIKMPTGGCYGSDDAMRTQVDAEARRVFLEEMRRPETPRRVEENATRLLTDVLTRHEDVLLAMRALLASGVSAAWTAFECLASDLWIAALNERPQAGTRALAELPGDANDDLTRKSISVRLLQKYGLDLRNTM